MKPEEINKKIAELLHSRLNLINGELLSSEELQKEVEGAAKEITDKVFEEISALPTIKGWVARNKNGKLYFFLVVPQRGPISWVPLTDKWFELDEYFFPDLRWEDEANKVELPIIRK